MNNRAVLIAIGAGAAALMFSRQSNARGTVVQGGYVPFEPLPDTSTAIAMPSLDWLTADYSEPTYTPPPDAVLPGDYADALPGSDLFYPPPADPAWTPWDADDMEAGGTWGDVGGELATGTPTGGIINVDLDTGKQNLRAFLSAIRYAEGTADADGYRALYGYRPGNGKVFEDFADHPRISFKTPWGTTSAAGAYQMQAGTWDDARAGLASQGVDLIDFSPEAQDRAAVWIIEHKRRALSDILSGRIHSALAKLRKEWASLPTSDSGQPKRSLQDFLRKFISYGGGLDPTDPGYTTYA